MNAKAGFTLLEMLIALSLLGLLGLVMVGIANLTQKAGSTLTQSGESREQYVIARELMHREISSASLIVTRTLDDPTTWFVGQRQSITFVAPARDVGPHRGLVGWSFFVALTPQGKPELRFRLTPLELNDDSRLRILLEALRKGEERTLLPVSQSSAGFGYLDGPAGRWSSVWKDETRLPYAVRWNDAGGGPPLFIRLGIRTPAFCTTREAEEIGLCQLP